MPHPVVIHLQFTRSKWRDGLNGVSEEEAIKQFGQMNCISWAIGHLAAFEQRAWVENIQGKTVSEAVKACGYGKPASTPPLAEMLKAWEQIIIEADAYLNDLTTEDLMAHPIFRGKPSSENVGTQIQRYTYHYWYHLGEVQAIRQLLGHQNLPPFVGSMPSDVHFRG